jgi:tetratricopeptide (TPR) repeat protein
MTASLTDGRRLGLTLLVLVALSALSPAGAQPEAAQRAFAQGNQRYADSAYAEAAEAYQQVLHTGYASGALYYNLGNTYFRLDRLGEAIRYYEKARLHLPATERVEHNLSIARARLDVSAARASAGWGGWLQVLDASPLFGLGLLLYLLGLGLGGAIVWLRHTNATTRRVAWGLGLSGLLIVGLALAGSWARTADDRAIVVTGSAPLHSAPLANAPADTTLTEGVMLQRGARRGAWTAVRLSDGTRGWLRSETLGGI